MHFFTFFLQGNLVRALVSASTKMDKIDYSRYGFMTDGDIEVLNAMAIPLGKYEYLYCTCSNNDDDYKDEKTVMIKEMENIYNYRVDMFLCLL